MEKNKEKLLITGVSGLLGNNLAYYFKDKYQVLGLYNAHPVTLDSIATARCDLFDSGNIKKIIAEFEPGIIIHCASLTDIDKCETEKETTRKINVNATRDIVVAIDNRTVKLIYISSDSVYDGVKGEFSETDDINPQNFYGRSKYEGELEVSKLEDSLVFRTNIFGWNLQAKNSLGEWVLYNLREKQVIHGFYDAYFSTIYTREFARIIDASIRKNLTGIYNCGSPRACSKYEFAQKIARRFGFDYGIVHPVSIDASHFKAKRGKNLSLNVSRLENELGCFLPDIDQSVDRFYQDRNKDRSVDAGRHQSPRGETETFIPYGRQWIDQDDIDAVVNVLRCDRITQGSKVSEFETALAQICKAKFAVAVNSGTSALHIACLAAGVGPGDEVITTPITFVASANCAVYCGARPVFADIDPRTYNISPLEIEKRLTPKTRAIIPVHFAGQSCDMITIRRVVEKAETKYGHKISLIEDASHALGSYYFHDPVSSCRYSDMAVTSFHPVKHITTGEGGAVMTADDELYWKLNKFRSHGITNTPSELIYKDSGFTQTESSKIPVMNPWYYEQQLLGFNYRITDIQCALGLTQLKKIETFRKRRKEIVVGYNEAFQDLDHIITPFEAEGCDSNFHLYVLQFEFQKIGIDRRTFMLALKTQGIQTQVHYIPVHTQPYYQNHFQTRWGDYPEAEAYYSRCLSIPLFPQMQAVHVERVIRAIKTLVKGHFK